MKPLVLYHGPHCADGFCSAWVAWRHFGDSADYVPINYGDTPPDVTGREVYILDFSFKRPVMTELIRAAKRLTCLDHHRTAQAELEGLDGGAAYPYIHFDMDKSGARLAWEFFFPGQTVPWPVDFVQDRDLWKWKLPQSKEVSAALASYPKTFQQWENFAACPNGAFAVEGAAILRYQAQLVETAVANAVETTIAGHSVLCTNATTLMSEIGERLAQGRPFGATFFVNSRGGRVYSLRSREGGIDVSEVAKTMGGGGHRNAAGFTAP